MARKSRKQEFKADNNKKTYSVGIYARLSQEEKVGYKNCQSLQNQISFDKNYVLSCCDMVLYKIYTDNGYSGTNLVEV